MTRREMRVPRVRERLCDRVRRHGDTHARVRCDESSSRDGPRAHAEECRPTPFPRGRDEDAEDEDGASPMGRRQGA